MRLVIGAIGCCLWVLAHADSCVTAADTGQKPNCQERALRCMAIPEPDMRLSCFDRIFPPTTTADKPTHAPATGESQGERRPPAVAMPADLSDDEAFPVLGVPVLRDEKARVKMEARIVRLQKGTTGSMTVVLDNNQIWRELSPTGLQYRVDAKVIIQHGALGSVNLSLEGSARSAKVKRIK